VLRDSSHSRNALSSSMSVRPRGAGRRTLPPGDAARPAPWMRCENEPSRDGSGRESEAAVPSKRHASTACATVTALTVWQAGVPSIRKGVWRYVIFRVNGVFWE
jgi:hypothetical protein